MQTTSSQASPLRLYVGRDWHLYLKAGRVNPILRYALRQLECEPSFTGAVQSAFPFVLVSDIEAADMCLLPFTWNHYVETRRINEARAFVGMASRADRQTIVVSEGDSPANLPLRQVILLEKSAYSSRIAKGQYRSIALPVFLPDYVDVYCDGKPPIRRKSERPVVGFCGQAGGSVFDFACRGAMNIARRIAHKLSLAPWEPAPVEHTRLRKRVLDLLSRCDLIDCSFVVRTRYRAGYQPLVKDPFHPTRLEFVNNVLNTDYTLCLRGGGNFSARFYETLCLGRIPVFINTDCLLPLDETLNYRSCCVWVEQHEIQYVGEKLANYHAALSDDAFQELQVRCRRIWTDYLRTDSYFMQLSKLLSAGRSLPNSPQGGLA